MEDLKANIIYNYNLKLAIVVILTASHNWREVMIIRILKELGLEIFKQKETTKYDIF